MKKEYFFIAVFSLVVAVTCYLFFRILMPFFTPIAWAAIFAIIFYPLYQKTQRWVKWDSLRALLFTILILLLIIGPALYLTIALTEEAVNVYEMTREWVEEGKFEELTAKGWPILQEWFEQIEDAIGPFDIDPQNLMKTLTEAISKIAVSQGTALVGFTGRFIFYFSLMIFAMFYFFRDGVKLFQQIKQVIPMSSEKAEATVNHLRRVIEGTMYGGVVVAIIQGSLAGLMFAILGLPSAIFWGAVMTFMAFIPILGPYIIYTPASIILIATGSPVKGIVLFTVGTIIVSQVDNLLRPLLVSGQTGLHTLLLFFAILGGINLFGLLGIILGPFIAALFVAIFEIFRLKLTEDEQVTIDVAPEKGEGGE